MKTNSSIALIFANVAKPATVSLVNKISQPSSGMGASNLLDTEKGPEGFDFAAILNGMSSTGQRATQAVTNGNHKNSGISVKERMKNALAEGVFAGSIMPVGEQENKKNNNVIGNQSFNEGAEPSSFLKKNPVANDIISLLNAVPDISQNIQNKDAIISAIQSGTLPESVLESIQHILQTSNLPLENKLQEISGLISGFNTEIVQGSVNQLDVGPEDFAVLQKSDKSETFSMLHPKSSLGKNISVTNSATTQGNQGINIVVQIEDAHPQAKVGVLQPQENGQPSLRDTISVISSSTPLAGAVMQEQKAGFANSTSKVESFLDNMTSPKTEITGSNTGNSSNQFSQSGNFAGLGKEVMPSSFTSSAISHESNFDELLNTTQSTSQSRETRTSVLSQISVQIKMSDTEKADSFKINLKPRELGSVEIDVQFDNDGNAKIVFRAENTQTLDLLKNERSQLANIFRDNGYSNSNTGFTFEHKDQKQENGKQGNRSGSHSNNVDINSGPDELDASEENIITDTKINIIA